MAKKWQAGGINTDDLSQDFGNGQDMIGKSGYIENRAELDRLGIPTGLDIDMSGMAQQLASAQSVGEQAKNMLVGGGKLAVAGLIDYLGTWDLTQGIDALQDVQREYGDNLMHKWASEIRNDVQKDNPLYAKDPGSVDFGDFAWYANHVQQVGYSTGMIGTMFLESALLGAVTGGLGSSATLAKLEKLPGIFNKLRALYSDSKSLTLAKNMGYGLFSGFREAELNMAHTYDEILMKFRQEGYSDDEARTFASAAASTAFQTELVPAMTLNMAQFAMLSYNPVTKQFVNNLEHGIGSVVKNKIAKGAISTAMQMGTEGFEEVWQGMSANRGKEFADYLAGKRSDYSFFSKEYMGTADMWNEFIGGATGGGVFAGFGSLYNKFQTRNDVKRLETARQQWSTDIEARRIQNLDKIRIARDNGDEATARLLEADNNFYTVASALHTDARSNGNTNLYQANLDLLEGALASVQANDVEAIQKFFPGLDINMNMLAEKLPEYISDAQRIKEIYDLNQNLDYTSDAVIPITYREFQIEKNTKAISDINAELGNVEHQLPQFEKLTNQGKQLYQAQSNQRANKTTLEYLKSQLKHTKDADERTAIQESIDSLSSLIQATESLITPDAVYGSDYLARQHDEPIRLAIGENSKYDNLTKARRLIESENQTMNNELAKWKDKYFQSGLVQRSIQNSFDQITNIAQLEEFQTQLQDKGLEVKEWQDRITQKRRNIENVEKKSTEPEAVNPVTTPRVETKPKVQQQVKPQPTETQQQTQQEVQPQSETIEDYENFVPSGEAFNDEYNKALHSGKVLYEGNGGFRLLEQTDENGVKTYRVTNADKLYHTKAYKTVDQALDNMKKNTNGIKPTKKTIVQQQVPSVENQQPTPTSVNKNQNRNKNQNPRMETVTDQDVSKKVNDIAHKIAHAQPLTAEENKFYQQFKDVIQPEVEKQIPTLQDENPVPTTEEEKQAVDQQVKLEGAVTNVVELLRQQIDAAYQKPVHPQNINQDQTIKDDLIDSALNTSTEDGFFTIDDTDYENFAMQVNVSEIASDPVVVQRFESLFEYSQDFEKAFDGFKSQTDKEFHYDFFKEGYKLVHERLGLPTISDSKFDSIYSKMFDSLEDRVAKLVELAPKFEVTETSQQIKEEKIKDIKEDSGGNINYSLPTILGYRINQASSKLAYTTFPTKLVEVESGVYQREVVDYSVQEDDFTDSTVLLDINKYQPGTRLVAKIPDEVLDIPVYIWNMDNSKINKVIVNGRQVNAPVDTLKPIDHLPFGEAIAKYPQIMDNDQLYMETVPMLIYDPSLGTGSRAVAAIHNVDWWNLNNVSGNDNQSAQDTVTEAQTVLRNQRQAIIDNGNTMDLVITSRGLAKTDRMQDSLGNNIYTSINEQNPDAQLAVYENGGFNTGNGLITEDRIVNSNFTKNIGGQYYMIPVGKNTDGQTLYEFANAYLNNTSLKKEIQDSIFNTIQAFVSNKLQANDQLTAHLRDLNITDNHSLGQYINQFLRPLPVSTDGKTEVQIHNELKQLVDNGNIQAGEIYFYVSGNSITLFKTGKALAKYKGVDVSFVSVPTNVTENMTSQNIIGFLNNFMKNHTDENSILDVTNTTDYFPIRLNIDKKKIASQNPINVLIKDDNGSFRVLPLESSTGQSTYASIMKDMFTTNIAGIRASNGKYYSANNSVINYDTTNNKSEINPTQEAILEVNPILNEVPEFAELQENQNGLTELQQEFLQEIQTKAWITMEQRFPGTTLMQARQAFPNNFGEFFNEDGTPKIDTGNEQFSFINKLTNEDVAALTQASIKVENLSKTQLNNIINFLTGNIYMELIDKSGEIINKRELFANLQDKINTIIDEQSNQLRYLVSTMQKFGVNPNTQNMVDLYKNELKSLDSAKNNIIKIINYTLDSIQQELNIKQVERQFKKGDVIHNFEISPEYQDLFTNNTPIEFIQYNDNDTIKVRQQKSDQTNEQVDTYDIKINNIDELLEFQQDENLDEDSTDVEQDVLKNNEVERNHSKSSLEQDHKQAMNTKVKMLLKTLIDVDNTGKPRVGSFNLPQFNSVDNLWKKLQSVLTNNNVTGNLTIMQNGESVSTEGSTLILTSDFNQMIEKLSQMSEANPWVPQLVERLQQSSQSVKNAFTYDMYKHAISMCKVLVSQNDARNNVVTILDANSNEIVRVIQSNWRSSLINQEDITLHLPDDKKSYKLSVVQHLLTQYQLLKNNPVLETFKTVTDITQISREQKKFLEDLRKWMGQMGLHVTPQTINYLVTNGLASNKSTNKLTFVNFNDLFGITNKRSGQANPFDNSHLFAAIDQRLKYIEEKVIEQNDNPNDESKQIDYVNQEYNQLFYNLGGMLNRLAKVESQFTKTIITTTHNEGGKNINDISAFNFITQFADELKANNNNERTSKLGFAYDGNSFDLQLLNSESYQQDMLVRYISPEAITIFGNNYVQDNKITSLADIDYEFVRLAGLMYTKQGKVTLPTAISDKYPNIAFRMGSIFNPTSSDKDQVFFWKKAIIDFKLRDFTQDVSGNITGVQTDVINFFRDQVVIPELARIIDHYNKAKHIGETPNTVHNHDGYNYAAQHFMMIPAMNNIQIEGVPLVTYLANIYEANQNITVDDVLGKINSEIVDVLTSVINKHVEDKLVVWKDNGYFTEDGKINLIDTGYFNSDDRQANELKGLTNPNKIKALAYDFTINNMFSNANYFMMFAGDIANYAADKMYKDKDSDGNLKFFEVDQNGNPVISRPKTPEVFNYMMIDGKIDTNLGKRLASMIAPRSVIADSQYDRYNQIVVRDTNEYSTNLQYLIDLYYSKEEAAKALPLTIQLTDLRTNTELTELSKRGQMNNILNELSDMFPYLAPYMDITSTDGQEYTTWKEHLDTIMRQGRLDDTIYEQAKEIYTKLSKGQELTTDELKFVFQPNKPVYNGHNIDEGYTKMIYVKTSSFPLLPQMTKGFPTGIDKVRQYMESVQEKTGKNTRLVYSSGIKSGLPLSNNVPSLWNSDGTFNEVLTTDNFDKHSLVLDRKYWGIQQDTPYKSGFKKEDKVSIVTQSMKMLPTLLVKVMNSAPETKFNIDGKNYSGKELMDRINNMYGTWIDKERQTLYDQLGMDPVTLKPKDLTTFMKKVQNLLITEAKKRNYSPQDIDSLKLTTIKDSTGKVRDIQFSVPIYFTPNSNKYEGLLNAIISSRLIDLKMPGNAYIVASQEGFISDMLGIDNSEMIFTKNWTGELLGQRKVNGKILPAQVICSSKFRMANGTMLNLMKKDSDGNYIYIDQAENGSFILKEDMIDPDLLTLSSFRIPYSGPQSGPSIEIVGFFPGEKSGDLMIVPKNHVTQIGEDFDVDKRYTYQLWNFVNTKTNKVEKIEKKFGEFTSDELIRVIDSARKYMNTYKLYDDEFETMKAHGMYDEGATTGSADLTLTTAFRELATQIAEDADIIGYSKLKDIWFKVLPNFNHLDKMYSKLVQNEIIKGYNAITNSPSQIIQREMNKVLSTDESQEQGKLLEKLRGQGTDNTLSTILSDEYQKRKMKSGATAKLGIAIYSNALVLHNMVQQSDKSIRLQEYIPNDLGDGRTQNIEISFGNIVTDGILGKEEPIKPSGMSDSVWKQTVRSIGDIFNELQNVSTDNEKLQLYGKLGLNAITTNVDVMMTMLGIKYDSVNIAGKDTTISLPHFLISQPLIQEYVTKLQNKQANLSEFDLNAEQAVLNDLLAVNSTRQDTWNAVQADKNNYWKNLTGQELYNQLNGEVNDTTQLAALNFFLEMKDYMFLLSKTYSQLNIQSSGLGRSIFDVQNIEEGFQSFISDSIINKRINKSLQNINSLVGEFRTEDEYQALPTTEKSQYSWYGNKGYWFKANTINGNMIYNSIMAHTNVFERFYPFTSDEFNLVFQQILDSLGYQEMSKNKKVRLKEKMFSEMKKYLFSHQTFGLYSGDIQTERERLLKDYRDKKDVLRSENVKYEKPNNEQVVIRLSDGTQMLFSFKNNSLESVNKDGKSVLKFENGVYNLYNREDVLAKLSLASYLQQLTALDSPAALFVKNNFLIQDFSYDVSINNGLSFMRYRTVSEKNYDQEDIYNAIIELMDKNIELDSINGWNDGNSYTTRDLAEDLIIHAYINQGGVQSAIEYVKNIPIAVLERIIATKGQSFAQKLRVLQDNFSPKYEVTQNGETIKVTNPFSLRIFGYEGNDIASTVQRQIIQNNPSWGKKISSTDYQQASAIYSNSDLIEMGLLGMNVISMKDGKDTGTQFVVEYSRKAKQETGKPYRVFEKVGKGLYKEIPTLGNSFIHEYDPSKPYIQSILNNKNSKPVTPSITKPVMVPKVDNSFTTLPFEIESLDLPQILNSIAISEKTVLAPFAAKLAELDIFQKPIPVVLGSKWSFNMATNTITFNQNELTTNTSQNLIASRILEELLHSVLSPELVKYFNGGTTDSTVYKDRNAETPTYISNIGSLFLQSNKAIKQLLLEKYPNNKTLYADSYAKIVKVRQEIAEYGYQITELNDIDELVYSVSDIFEFTARMLSNPTIIRELGQVKYSGANKTILDRFKEIINQFLYNLGLKVQDGSIAAQGINQMFEFLETLSVKENKIADVAKISETNDLTATLSDQVDNLVIEDEISAENAPIDLNTIDKLQQLLNTDDLASLAVQMSPQEIQEFNRQKEEGCK